MHGQIQVHYQRSGNLFSTFATMIPKTAGRREINRGDVGCFGMSLAGVDDWQRISHATIAFNKQGEIHLATHYASSQPKSIFVYRLDVKFPSNREGGKDCHCCVIDIIIDIIIFNLFWQRFNVYQ
jgi:hypothetical protein